MSLSKQSKNISVVLGIVILLLVVLLILQQGSITLFAIASLTPEDLLSWNFEQLFILAWELFWIVFAIIITYRIIKYAKKRPADSLIHRLEKLESWWVFGSVAGLTLLAVVTIPIAAPFLYGPFGQNANVANAQEIEITASQFSFNIVYVNGVGNSLTTPLDSNEFIRFSLSTTDVTHGFGLYNENGDIVIQSQIIPDQTTLITMKLKPGTYSIICMEYCGYTHHQMISQNSINVAEV